MIENTTTEFKREYTEDIKYAVVAFANTEGGRLYIGVEDDGSVRGVENTDETILRLTNMIRDAIRPDVTMFTACAVERMEGKAVVVLSVQRGTARPYYLAKKGVRPEGVYVRQNASSVPASETVILNMIKETSGDRYEDARFIDQQLTFEKAEQYFAKRGLPLGEQQKRTLHIIGADGTYTNLGMLLSDQCVHGIKLAVFDGSKKTVFRDRKELSGSLLAQLEEAYAYIDQFNHTRAEFSGLDRIDRRDYPSEALREALLNAVTHRDYSFSGPTLISIFDDRIEFVSIGGLVRGLTFEDIMLGVSVLRNQNLANIFYRLKLIEAYGTGILKIQESYADCAVKPQFEVTDNAFKITLPNLNYVGERKNDPAPRPVSDKESRQERLLRLAEKQGAIVRKDVETELQVSQATAILILRDMVEQGLLVKEGCGKHLKYRIAE